MIRRLRRLAQIRIAEGFGLDSPVFLNGSTFFIRGHRRNPGIRQEIFTWNRRLSY